MRKFFKIERTNLFMDRVIALSLPPAIVLMVLVSLQLISPLVAIVSYAGMLLFNMAFLFPMTYEMQQIKKYIADLTKGKNFDEKEMVMSDVEVRDIVDAVNAMHRFWAHKTDELEARCMSDTAVLDALPDPLLMIDRSGNILGANLSARALLGDKILDSNVERIFDSPNFVNAVSKVLKKESENENLIFYVTKPYEQKLYAHIKRLPWMSRGRAVAVISVYDLTKSMKIEQMQSDFVANASHELRTPLTIISGFVETLQTTAKDDEEARDKFLQIMREQAEFMSSLIDNLLSLSKIEMSLDEKPSEKLKVKKVIDDVAKALSVKAKDREIKIVTRVDADVKAIVADGAQVRQLIQNLTDNAIKYGTAKSDVSIKAMMVERIPASKSIKVASGAAVAISINNKGAKITAENLARLTERFYRLQEHKNLNIKGTGLGLSIAKNIVIRHQGNLTVTSTNYNGTTFTIYLPLVQDEI